MSESGAELHAEPATGPAIQKMRALWLVLFGVAIAAGIFMRFSHLRDLRYCIWADRDLMRAANLGEEFQVMGPELTGRDKTRVPGGFYYYLLRAIMVVSPNPAAIYFAEILLTLAGMPLLYLLVRRYFDRTAALATVALYSMSVTEAWMHIRFAMSNPAFTPLFIVLAFWLIVDILIENKTNRLPWLFIVAGLVAQIHLSCWLLIVFGLVGLAVFRIRVPLKTWLASLGGLALVMSPYLAFEAGHGFPNTSKMLNWVNVHSGKLKYLAERYLRFDAICEWLFGVAPAEHWPAGNEPATFALYVAQNILPAFVVGCSMLLLLHAGSRGQLYRSLGMNEKQRKLVLMTFFVVGIAVVFAVPGRLYTHRLLYVVPVISMLGGICFSAFLSRLYTHGRAGIVLSMVFLAVTGAQFQGMYRTLTVTHPVYQEPRWEFFPSIQYSYKIIDALRSDFGYTDMDLETKVALMRRSPHNGEWELETPIKEEVYSYLIRTRARVPARGERFDGAVVAVELAGGDAGSDPAALQQALRGLVLELHPMEFDRSLKLDGIFLLSYRMPDGNCIRSMNNRYHYFPEEQILKRSRDLLQSEGAIPLDNGDGVCRIMVRKDGFLEVYVMLECIREAGGLRVVLHSNDLRGYDGNSHFELWNPRLELKGADGAVTVIRIFEGEFGGYDSRNGWPNLYLPPWRSPLVAVPDGEYTVRILADRIDMSCYGYNDEDEQTYSFDFEMEESLVFTSNAVSF